MLKYGALSVHMDHIYESCISSTCKTCRPRAPREVKQALALANQLLGPQSMSYSVCGSGIPVDIPAGGLMEGECLYPHWDMQTKRQSKRKEGKDGLGASRGAGGKRQRSAKAEQESFA